MTTRRFALHAQLARGRRSSVWALEALSDATGVEGRVRTVDLDTSWGAGPWVVKVGHDPDAVAATEALGNEAACQARAEGPGVGVVGGVVHVTDLEAGDATMPGLVMQRLAGMSLATSVDAATSRSAAPAAAGVATDAVDVVTGLVELASLLGRLHHAGVVHGDVAPNNVLVHGTGVAIVDFGSAHLIDAGGGGSAAGATGTPGFAAPEVVAGDPATVASDVFGLGALGLWWLAESPGLDDRRRAIVGAWCESLTERTPAARPDDLDAAAGILEDLCGSSTSRPRTVEFGPRPPRPEAVEPVAMRRATARTVAAVAAALVVCAVGLAGGTSWHSRSPLDHGSDKSRGTAAACRGEGHAWELHSGETRQVDVLDVGCAQRVQWSHQVLTVTRRDGTRSGTTDRFAIGKPGDRAFLGAWGCARHVSLSIYRPATGEIMTWRMLPSTPGAAQGARPQRNTTGLRNGHAQVSEDRRGCARLSVTEASE